MDNENLSNYAPENPKWASLSQENFDNKKAYEGVEAPEDKTDPEEHDLADKSTNEVEKPASEFVPTQEDANLAETNVNSVEQPASEFTPIPNDIHFEETNHDSIKKPENIINPENVPADIYDTTKKPEGDFNPNPDDKGPEEGTNFNSH